MPLHRQMPAGNHPEIFNTGPAASRFANITFSGGEIEKRIGSRYEFRRGCCFFLWLDTASEESAGKAFRSSDTLGCKYRLPTGRKSVGDCGDRLETHKSGQQKTGGACT